MTKIVKYIENKIGDDLAIIGEFSVLGKPIYVQDHVPTNIDVTKTFKEILEKMPSIFFSNIERFVLGNFNFLKQREVDAVYKNKIVYLTNQQENEETLKADIIHEIAHAFEEKFYSEIYKDGQIENEFIGKRHSLYELLATHKLLTVSISREDFYQTEYNQRFDNFLYKEIGYGKLSSITKSLFISPYAATSLREYFANAFENFFVNDVFIVKKHCPSIYSKMTNFLEF